MTRKLVIAVLLTAAISACISIAAMALMLRPVRTAIDPVDISQVADGSYIGVHQNKIIFGVVQVAVSNHAISAIDVLYHKDSYMPQATQIADSIVLSQSLDVDTISGATFTCDTIKKAVENALLQGVPASNKPTP